METAEPSPLDPIGVFDSGIGGLTVAAATRSLLPSENIFYIGDTARVPYGGKSRRTVERYSVEIGGLLLAARAKMIVVACNTASALAVPRLQSLFNIPILGVVNPGASAAVTVTHNHRIGVIGTKATISSLAYEHAISSLAPHAHVHSVACPLLVPLIEEGLLDDPITDLAIARYLAPLLDKDIDTLVLGCTHYPLLKNALARFVGSQITLVDSAWNCAQAVRQCLDVTGLNAPPEHLGSLEISLTDSSEGFLRTAVAALGLNIGDINLLAVQS